MPLDSVPHSAIIFVRYSIHEKRPDGLFDPTFKDKGEFTWKVDGDDLDWCKKNLNESLNALRNKGLEYNG